MGFSLFGRSGDNKTENTTVNETYDYTTSNSNNTEGSYNQSDSRVYNTALTSNQSAINNDTRIQNTALQLTDSFNRFTTNNLANVGNTNIGASGTNADDTAKLLAIMKDLQPPRGLNDAAPDLTKPLLDFLGISKIATDNIKASTDQTKAVFGGFADNVTATGKTLSATQETSTNSLLKWALIGAAVLGGLYIVMRKGN